jgi:hypothetical protein
MLNKLFLENVFFRCDGVNGWDFGSFENSNSLRWKANVSGTFHQNFFTLEQNMNKSFINFRLLLRFRNECQTETNYQSRIIHLLAHQRLLIEFGDAVIIVHIIKGNK